VAIVGFDEREAPVVDFAHQRVIICETASGMRSSKFPAY
jgi:hypothetical protein